MKINTVIKIKKNIIIFDKYIFFGLLKFIYKHLIKKFISSGNTFNGWGMTTQTNLPWKNTLNNESKEFEKINKALLNLVKKKKIYFNSIS